MQTLSGKVAVITGVESRGGAGDCKLQNANWACGKPGKTRHYHPAPGQHLVVRARLLPPIKGGE